mmetsp:Transcript_15421/g.33148  ORF Transcript_15421/g.33148 Transcript_15421/m.33148 type:complete len:216 (-) Transcript_15421:1889-2536(-)
MRHHPNDIWHALIIRVLIHCAGTTNSIILVNGLKPAPSIRDNQATHVQEGRLILIDEGVKAKACMHLFDVGKYSVLDQILFEFIVIETKEFLVAIVFQQVGMDSCREKVGYVRGCQSETCPLKVNEPDVQIVGTRRSEEEIRLLWITMRKRPVLSVRLRYGIDGKRMSQTTIFFRHRLQPLPEIVPIFFGLQFLSAFELTRRPSLRNVFALIQSL